MPGSREVYCFLIEDLKNEFDYIDILNVFKILHSGNSLTNALKLKIASGEKQFQTKKAIQSKSIRKRFLQFGIYSIFIIIAEFFYRNVRKNSCLDSCIQIKIVFGIGYFNFCMLQFECIHSSGVI